MHVGNLTAGILERNDELVVNVDNIALRRRHAYCTEPMNNNTFGIIDIGYRIVDIRYRIHANVSLSRRSLDSIF